MEQQCVYIGWWSHTMTHDNTLERGYPVLGRGAMKNIGILLYTRVISGAGTTHSSGAPEFTPGF